MLIFLAIYLDALFDLIWLKFRHPWLDTFSKAWSFLKSKKSLFFIFFIYTANFSPIKSAGDPRVAKHTL